MRPLCRRRGVREAIFPARIAFSQKIRIFVCFLAGCAQAEQSKRGGRTHLKHLK